MPMALAGGGGRWTHTPCLVRPLKLVELTKQQQFDVLGRLNAVFFERLLDYLIPLERLPLLGAH